MIQGAPFLTSFRNAARRVHLFSPSRSRFTSDTTSSIWRLLANHDHCGEKWGWANKREEKNTRGEHRGLRHSRVDIEFFTVGQKKAHAKTPCELASKGAMCKTESCAPGSRHESHLQNEREGSRSLLQVNKCRLSCYDETLRQF